MSPASYVLWQFDGLLDSNNLTYLPSFAVKSTFSRMHLHPLCNKVGCEAHHSTGNPYTVVVYQRRPRVLTCDIGKQEVGLTHIKIESAHLVDASSFRAPLPSFEIDAATSQSASSLKHADDPAGGRASIRRSLRERYLV